MPKKGTLGCLAKSHGQWWVCLAPRSDFWEPNNFQSFHLQIISTHVRKSAEDFFGDHKSVKMKRMLWGHFNNLHFNTGAFESSDWTLWKTPVDNPVGRVKQLEDPGGFNLFRTNGNLNQPRMIWKLVWMKVVGSGPWFVLSLFCFFRFSLHWMEAEDHGQSWTDGLAEPACWTKRFGDFEPICNRDVTESWKGDFSKRWERIGQKLISEDDNFGARVLKVLHFSQSQTRLKILSDAKFTEVRRTGDSHWYRRTFWSAALIKSMV